MTTLFVSDVHLSTARQGMVDTFVSFLCGPARAADGLYILGDLFDEWLGDDDAKPPHPGIVEALGALSRSGVPLRCLHGNHDFLLGSEFVERTGCELLPDPSVVHVEGTPVLLMHGDSLCTRDVEYQAFRKMTRDPDNQQRFLGLTLEQRRAEADSYRRQSEKDVALKANDIMDVTPAAVEETMREHGVRHLVHGHTHRPDIHEIELDGASATRVVLGDWYERDSVLIWDASGFRLGRITDLAT